MIEEKDDFEDMFDDEVQTEPENTDDKPAETEAKAEDTPEPQTEEPSPETTEAKEPEPEQPVDAQEAPETPIEPVVDTSGASIPQSAFTAMREDLKGQIALLQNQLASQQAAQAQPAPQTQQQKPEEIPDSILDPQGFAEWQRNEIQRTASDLVFKNNLAAAEARELASGKTLDELRQEADPFIAAAHNDAQLVQSFKASHDPVAFIRSWNARQTAQAELAKYGGDLSAYTAAKIAEAQAGGIPATPAPTQQAPVTAPIAPRSIVDTRPATEIAGAQVDDADDFEAIFS